MRTSLQVLRDAIEVLAYEYEVALMLEQYSMVFYSLAVV